MFERKIKAWHINKPGTLDMIEVNYDAVKLYRERALEKDRQIAARAYQELIVKLDELKMHNIEITPAVFEDTVNALLDEIKERIKNIKAQRKDSATPPEKKRELKLQKRYLQDARTYLKQFSYKEKLEDDAALAVLLVMNCM